MSRIRYMLVFLLCALLILPLRGSAAVPKQPLPILMYHHIVPDGEAAEGMTVTAASFRADMQWLREHGYSFVLPRELAAGDIPDKPVMVTFDDGYSSNYDVLFPILREMDVKAAIALVVSMPDQRQSENFLSWDMCREMSDSGLVEFGSHTYDLHNFDGRGGMYTPGKPNGIQRLEGEQRADYEARVCGDLQKSIDAIEAHLDVPVTYLAYPFGERDPWAEDYIREHFALTVTTHSAVADLDMGLYGMDRLTIAVSQPVDSYLKR